MNSNKDYFKLLAKKIEKDVPVELDQKVLSQLPQSNNRLHWGIPSFAVACLAIVLVFNFPSNDPRISSNMLALVDMLSEEEFLEDLDYHIELGEVDITKLTDEEWELLLEGEEEDV